MAIHRGCEKCRRSADSVFEEHDAKIAAVERRGADAKRMEMGSQRRS
jgi:ferredoxin